MGLADRLVPYSQIDAVIDAVARVGADTAFATLPGANNSQIIEQQHWIDQCYNGSSVQQIRDQLAAHSDAAARDAARIIDAAAPLALTVTFEAMRLTSHLVSLEEALNQDYRMVYALFRSADLIEGIRAQVIDKDRNPQWQPARLEDVTRQMTAEYFANTPTLPFPTGAADT